MLGWLVALTGPRERTTNFTNRSHSCATVFCGLSVALARSDEAFDRGTELAHFLMTRKRWHGASESGSKSDGQLEWKEETMLWTISVLFLILWLLGMVSSYTLGGFIHILLLLAIVSVLVRIIQGRRVV